MEKSQKRCVAEEGLIEKFAASGYQLTEMAFLKVLDGFSDEQIEALSVFSSNSDMGKLLGYLRLIRLIDGLNNATDDEDIGDWLGSIKDTFLPDMH
jgi:hypothetical protein